METDSAALATHAAETVADAHGRALVLLAAADAWGPLPPTVESTLLSRDLADVDGVVDSVVSVGQLATMPDLRGWLTALLGHATAETRLLFCEPTIVTDEVTVEPPHDITTSLWASGWTVIDCRRFRSGRGRSAQEYVWGRARPTPSVRTRPPGRA